MLGGPEPAELEWGPPVDESRPDHATQTGMYDAW
jgi:hypothetical protein